MSNPEARCHPQHDERPTASRTSSGELWQRAVQLPIPRGRDDRFRCTLDLLRLSRHDPSALRDAARIGHRLRCRLPGDDDIRRATRALDDARDFLGMLDGPPRPRLFAVAPIT